MRLNILIRKVIKRRPSIYLHRWQKACDKCWGIFASEQPSPEVLSRLQRTHTRLMRIAAKKKPFNSNG